MPNLYIGLGLPLTAPLATVVLFWALVVKFLRDADDDPRAFQAGQPAAGRSHRCSTSSPRSTASRPPTRSRRSTGWPAWAASRRALVADPTPASTRSPGRSNGSSLGLFFLTGGALFVRYLLRLGREPPAAGAGGRVAKPRAGRAGCARSARPRRLGSAALRCLPDDRLSHCVAFPSSRTQRGASPSGTDSAPRRHHRM